LSKRLENTHVWIVLALLPKLKSLRSVYNIFLEDANDPVRLKVGVLSEPLAQIPYIVTFSEVSEACKR
jgi:hypothetical protein